MNYFTEPKGPKTSQGGPKPAAAPQPVLSKNRKKP